MRKLTRIFSRFVTGITDRATCRHDYETQSATIDILLREAARRLAVPFNDYLFHDADFTCRKAGWLTNAWHNSVGLSQTPPIDHKLKMRAGRMARPATRFIYNADLSGNGLSGSGRHARLTPPALVFGALVDRMRPSAKTPATDVNQNNAADMIGVMLREYARTDLRHSCDNVTLLDAAYFYGIRAGQLSQHNGNAQQVIRETRRVLTKIRISGQPLIAQQFEMGLSRPSIRARGTEPAFVI